MVASLSKAPITIAEASIMPTEMKTLFLSVFGVGHMTFFSSLFISRNHLPILLKKPGLVSSFLTAVFGGSCANLLFFSHFHASFQKLLGFNMLGVLSAEGAILAALQTV